MKNSLSKEYLQPVRIVEQSANVVNSQALFDNHATQVFIKEPNYLSCVGRGYIILDFGKELQGGVRIISSFKEGQKTLLGMRIRFGESVDEACAELGEKNANCDHSVRDFTIGLPDLSDQEWGQTGFRFVRVDFLTEDKEYRLVNIYAASVYRELPYLGSFECDDGLVNQIYDTARYTIHLNMQTELWDGVKRDRLVWIGDMQPEVLAITDIFGADDCVERALRASVEKNPLPAWFGNIPTYSFWYIQIVYDYFLKVNNREFVLSSMPYIQGVLRQLDQCVLADGRIDYKQINVDARNGFFLDWPTNGTKDAEEGNRFMFVYTLRNLIKLYALLGMEEDPLCRSLIDRLILHRDEGVEAKQIVALGYLSGMLSAECAAPKLAAGGAKGLSTFMSYFILKALLESADTDTALDIMKAYYGGMLSRGATSFWEDFDIDWLQGSGRIDERTPQDLKSLHGDHGAFCYVGFRHSLCHGWSCGPVQFLMEEVLGIHVEEAGCRRIVIRPNMGSLRYCKGTFPTPFGVMTVSHQRVDGRIVSTVDAPQGVSVEIR